MIISLGQGYGRSLWLMQGMFRANGGCGYVKKPDFLLKAGPHNEVFDPEIALPIKKTLKVNKALLMLEFAFGFFIPLKVVFFSEVNLI